MTFAKRLKLARKRRGLGQRELSKLAGFSNSYVCHLERGDNLKLASKSKISNPGLDAIESLAKVLRVPVQWLAFGIGEEPDWSVAA